MSTTEELLGRKSSGSGLEIRDYGRSHPLLWLRDTLYPQKLPLTSTKCGGLSVGMVRSLTQAMEFFSCSVSELNILFVEFWPAVPFRLVGGMVKIEVVLVLNGLDTTPWRRLGNGDISPSFLNSVLDIDQRPASSPGLFTFVEWTSQYTLDRRLCTLWYREQHFSLVDNRPLKVQSVAISIPAKSLCWYWCILSFKWKFLWKGLCPPNGLNGVLTQKTKLGISNLMETSHLLQMFCCCEVFRVSVLVAYFVRVF
jgi:hypothetical protein